MAFQNRTEIIKKIARDEESKLLLARATDKLKECEQKNIPASTKFLNEQERSLAGRMLQSLGRVRHCFYGGYEGALRTVLFFLPDYLEPVQIMEDDNSPIAFIRADYPPESDLSHRDFLGSLMGLGITREAVGDILVGTGSCDLIVLKEIKAYVLANLETVGRVRVKTSAITSELLLIPEEKYVLVKDTVASLRVDNIVAAGFSLSRSKAVEAVEAGRTALNHLECTKADKAVAEGDVISLRGKGKIKLQEISHQTKKGRMAVVIKKYI